MKKIGVILGSTRPTRVSPQIATWFLRGKKPENIDFEIIDLKEINLPMFDEPLPPAMGIMTNTHTKKFASLISQYDGFVFILPEYNKGYPGVLKNAIDYLSKEWRNKPAAIIAFGMSAAGRHSANAFRVVTNSIGLQEITTSLEIRINSSMFNEQGQIKNIDEVFAQYDAERTKIISELAEK